MSYILDALRRAQAERNRGGVPDLHTPAAAPAELPATARGAGVPWLPLALLLALGLGAAGWWLGRATTATATTPPPAAPAGAAGATAAPVTPAAPPVALSAPPPLELPSPPPVAPPATPKPAPQRAAAPAPKAAPTERARSPAPAPAAAAPTEAPRAAGTVFAQADLPQAVRSQLPTLQLAGITYSSNPQHRMAIVNGQVLHEGDQAAPGLVLERIEQARTVWAFKGYRYALPAQ
ncbi:general secretion pathway protein GspB [Pulveribacter sp.]|uniref:general secretion pathway protein GspB n=1 Tax=Pulveribacter sp. TaxID=2678893 RepID=UPI0028AAA3D6|nr:general secretion pathway protein GspB [Pulveribacter sp.]